MSVKTTVLGVAAFSVVAYAGAYGYMYSKVKGGVEDMAAAAVLLGNVSYEGVSVSPIGSSFAINGLRFAPHGSNDTVSIEAVHVELDKMLEMMGLADGIDLTTELPRSAELRFEGVRISLYADWLRSLMQEAEAEIARLDYSSEVCGGSLMASRDDYIKLGFDEFMVDLSIGFEHEPVRAEIYTDVSVTLRHYGRFDYRVVTDGPTRAQLAAYMQLDGAGLREATMTYTDLGGVQKTNAYCAGADGISVAEYIDARVDQPDLDYLMTWGVVPGEALRAAYRRFLEDPQQVALHVDPGAGFDPATLHLYKPKDIPLLLNPELAVNGERVTDLSFRTADEVEIEEAELSQKAMRMASYSLPGRLGRLSSAFGEQPAVQETEVVAKAEPTYQRVPLRELRQHLGRDVKVYTRSGHLREGRLEAIEGKTLQVVRMVHGGRFTVPVKSEDVRRVEVLY
jgi:hypothetical protein